MNHRYLLLFGRAYLGEVSSENCPLLLLLRNSDL